MRDRSERFAPKDRGICQKCKHYRGDMKCEAFPEGISIEIFTGEFDHHNIHRNDRGIRFEPK